MRVAHTLEPIYDKNSKTLILGSMPSITSRQLGKYYGNPRNRFWSIMEAIYGEKIENWRAFILKHNLALWDVIKICDISSSDDQSIKNVLPNDITALITETKIQNVFTLGNKAYELYNKYIFPSTKLEAILLPSTSPANARASLESLITKYKIIKEKTESK